MRTDEERLRALPVHVGLGVARHASHMAMLVCIETPKQDTRLVSSMRTPYAAKGVSQLHIAYLNATYLVNKACT